MTTFLRDLCARERVTGRMLALVLLRLENDPRPEGSRALTVKTDPGKEERILEHGAFRIAYRVDDHARLVELGFVSRTAS